MYGLKGVHGYFDECICICFESCICNCILQGVYVRFSEVDMYVLQGACRNVFV